MKIWKKYVKKHTDKNVFPPSAVLHITLACLHNDNELTTNTSLSIRGWSRVCSKIQVFRIVAQCRLANSYRRFGTPPWHHLWGSVSPRKETTYRLAACYMIPQHTSVVTVAGEVRRNGASTDTLFQNIVSLQWQSDRRHQLQWDDVLTALNKTQQNSERNYILSFQEERRNSSSAVAVRCPTWVDRIFSKAV